MKIAVTSGKGGTGKTTVSTGLFHVLAKHGSHKVELIDCDVEEPDCHIFLKASKTSSLPVNMLVPVIDTGKCTFCGKCEEICAVNAIVMLPLVRFIEVVEELCNGCGACTYVCPEKAITEIENEIGQISFHDYHDKNDFTEGRMKVGVALQTKVIRETVKHINSNVITLLDSPPGTSCPVVATVRKADFVIMVTEPTPFGLHDLKLMHQTVVKLEKKHGIIVNKAGLNYTPLFDYINDNNIPLLGKIPFKKEYARAYAGGDVLTEVFPELHELFVEIANKVIDGKIV